MEKVKIYFDRDGNTLNVWFDDPTKECVSEEVGNEVILNKDSTGRVIGFEKLNFISVQDRKNEGKIPVEVFV